jgi:hypothetical protein
MSHPAPPQEAELRETAGQETVTDPQDWPFSHLHFDRRARTWIGHVDEPYQASPRGDDRTSPQLRCA